ETEDVLRAAVARLGVETEWGVRLTGVEQDPDGVRLRLTGADGVERSADSPWLIGCDGGHGTVRELLGLDLLDETGGRWMLADAPAGTGLPPDTLHWTRTSWTSVCAARRSTVPRMGEGRVFLAGNAAPVDSPAAGHAMNTGVQEAYNLAWKLAQVEQGHAGRELLDTYGQERAPAGRARRRSRRTPASAHRSGRLLVAPALSVVLALLWALPALRRTVQRRLLGGLSGLRTDYDASSLTTVESYEHVAGIGPVLLAGTVATPLPVAGERITAARIHDPDAPGCRALHGELRDPRWSLLLAAGGTGPGDVPVGVAVTAAVQYAEWLSVRTVGGHLPAEPGPLADPDGALRAALGLAPGCWLLVRPDGYVATRGAELTRTVLDHAFAPLRPRSPLIGAAPREPGIVLPAPNRRPEEH
ncbi:FAD-dependent monooxygenase, partial [Streptomyces sp. NPDC006552]|uniref:FAD-dependent monooxygenase n=1 Tax=Streptomyces sp. NPDC006552 TaxID=3157179 RepID=UPI0033A1640A